MRKQKSTSKQLPIQLSANKKFHSINLKNQQQPLFTPYKIEWKTSNTNADNLIFSGINPSMPLKQPFRNIENNAQNTIVSNSNSKAFYQNMKNELLNIKQDVEKMIIKEKKEKTIMNGDITSNETNNLTINASSINGYVKTINIKNKCQKKMQRVQSLYQNVQKALNHKNGDSNVSYAHRITSDESRNQHSNMNHLIEDQLKPTYGLEQKCRSEKDTYCRTKSKSIEDFFNNKLDFNPPSLKFFKQENVKEQNNFEEGNHYQPRQSKQKIELNIRLPYFQKRKQEQKRVDKEKEKLISQLQAQLSQLSNQLSLRDELMSRKQQCKFKLTEDVQKLKKQLKASQQKYEHHIFEHKQQLESKNDHILELQMHRNSFNSQFEQKLMQISRLQQNTHFQHNNIHQLSQKIKNLQTFIKQQQNTCRQSKEDDKISKQYEFLSQENKKIKQKLRLKENQLYIYQEELKQAKYKIKQLKETVNNFSEENSANKNIQEEQNLSSEKYLEIIRINQMAKKENQTLKNKNDQLNAEVERVLKANKQNQQKISKILTQNFDLKNKVATLEQEAQKVVQQTLQNAGMQNVGEEISMKFSEMVDQRYCLKNKISRLQANLQEMALKNKSLAQELRIYDDKIHSQKDFTRRLKIDDWDMLTLQRDQLQIQVQNVKSRFQQTKEFYEVEIMRKQNEIHELKERIQSILDFENAESEKSESDEKEHKVHPNVRSMKHIQNIDTLLNEFRDMIEYNLEMKQELDLMRLKPVK